ncbi:hypothetical protein, partial [uncultured Anaerotruncus sp.]|uniref:hypothetical protein n=1 Tax=uncultured Anaerotruncus sp. TaxID=905011 RepID=UPI00280B97B4
VPFLGDQERNSLSVDYRHAPTLDERKIQSDRRRSTTGRLGGKSPGGASVLLRLYGGLLRVLFSALTAVPAPTILKLQKTTSIQL